MSIHPIPRPGTAVSRTTDLLNACDEYARDGIALVPEHLAVTRGELLAIRHLCEGLTRIVQAHPTVAEFAEAHAAQACEALELTEEGT